jgi:uncharacterized damage-inducible protein DinB
MTRKEELLDTLRRSFDGDAWHGPAVLDTLSEVREAQALWQPPEGARTIWEIALHIAAWSNEVAQRLEGGKPGEPKEGDYPKPKGSWPDAIATVRAARDRLVKVVAGLSDDDLNKLIGAEHNAALATGFTYAGSIEGLAQHNAYHAGQMRMVLKIMGGLSWYKRVDE